MNVFSISKKALAVGAMFLLSAGVASAVNTLSDNGANALGTSLYYSSSGATPTGTGWVGARSLTYTPGVGAASTFWAYCIDPKTSAGFPSTAYVSTNLATFMNGTATSGYAQQVANTGTGYAGLNLNVTAAGQTAVMNNLISLFSHAYNDAIGTALPTTTQVASAKAAAFGMAVWEIIMQNNATGFSRTTGTMRSEGTTLASVDSADQWLDAYLNALNTGVWTSVNGANLSTTTSFTYTVWSDTAPGAQNFLQVTPGGSSSSVPVPGTLALAGFALFGAARVSRRRTVEA